MTRKILLIVLTICLLFTLSNPAFASGFSDIKGHWAEKEINRWAEKGLASGYSDGTFKPNKQVTRAEFVAMANRAFKLKNKGAAVDFTDVKPGQWYYNDVASAKAAGYIGGYSDGTFKPARTITRQEVACILVRLLGLQPAPKGIAAFGDSNRIPAWSRGSVGAVVQNKLMRGFPDNTFKPQKSITRAEAVVSLDRAVKYGSPTGVKVESAIEGTVTLDGKVSSGVDIRIFKAGSYKLLKETQTNKSGYFKVELEPGDYDLTAVTNKEVAYKSGVKVIKNKVTTANLILEDAAVLSGTLMDNGKVVKNATLLFTTNPTFITETDDNGKWTVAVLPDRKYTCRAFMPGEENEEPVTINEELNSGSPGRHYVGTLKVSLDNPVIGGGGGGGGSSALPQGEEPVVHSVTFVVDKESGPANVTVTGVNNVFTVDLTGYKPTDRFTGLTVNASENAKRAWLTISGITKNLEFDQGTASTTVSEILGPLDTGEPGVSLQRLIDFGIDTISVSVESVDNVRTEVTVMVNFPSN